jgi:hypothetical protein
MVEEEEVVVVVVVGKLPRCRRPREIGGGVGDVGGGGVGGVGGGVGVGGKVR